MTAADLTPEALEELERLEREATPGPWEHDTDGVHGHNGDRLRDFAIGPHGELFDTSNATDRELSYEADDEGTTYADRCGRANVELACALRNAAPALLASARRSSPMASRVAELEHAAKALAAKVKHAVVQERRLIWRAIQGIYELPGLPTELNHTQKTIMIWLESRGLTLDEAIVDGYERRDSERKARAAGLREAAEFLVSKEAEDHSQVWMRRELLKKAEEVENGQ